MRAAVSVLVVLAIACMLVVGVQAQEKKEVTLKGKITCAKCELKLPDAKGCATVIVVKEGGKDIVYYFDTKSHKENHTEICKAGKDGSVTGTVTEEKGKKTITATKVAFK
jgi:hypothetical protein